MKFHDLFISISKLYPSHVRSCEAAADVSKVSVQEDRQGFS